MLDRLPCFPFEFQFVNNNCCCYCDGGRRSTKDPRLSKSSRNVGQRFTAAGMEQRNKAYTGHFPIANSLRMNGLLCALRKGNCSALLRLCVLYVLAEQLETE